MKTSITEEQKKQYKRFVEDTADKALVEVGLDKDGIQNLIENGGKFQDDVIASIRKHSVKNVPFVFVKDFQLTVPDGYDHATRFDSFARGNRKRFYFYNNAITDENFGKVTTKLVPGRKFTVKVFEITRQVASEECMKFLKTQKAVFTGAQGASLVWELKKEELPIGKWSISFDEKDAHWKDSGGFRGVPRLRRFSGGDWEFSLGFFEYDWHVDFCLLCFCDF